MRPKSETSNFELLVPSKGIVMMIGRNSSALGDDSGVEWDLSPLLDYS